MSVPFPSLHLRLRAARSGCERILRTPCPPGYVGVLRLSLVFFLLLLPFVLLEIGCKTAPMMLLSTFLQPPALL